MQDWEVHFWDEISREWAMIEIGRCPDLSEVDPEEAVRVANQAIDGQAAGGDEPGDWAVVGAARVGETITGEVRSSRGHRGVIVIMEA
jgi:hypothetical protein